MADVRLADRVFAPHYAAPMTQYARASTTIHAAPSADSEIVGKLQAGATFEVLEIASTFSWGTSRDDRVVGYVANEALSGEGEAPNAA